MNKQSKLKKSPLPLWVENYPTGYINMKTNEISTYKPNILKYNYIIETTNQIINGSNMLDDKELKPIKPILFEYEGFICKNKLNISRENFLLPFNITSHRNPVWVLYIVLMAIWIIFSIA